MSDTAMFLAGAWCLLGWLAGFALAVSLFWRRITKPVDGTVRLLRLQIDDDTARLRRQQDIIDELTAEVGQLYTSKDRLARRLLDASGERVA